MTYFCRIHFLVMFVFLFKIQVFSQTPLISVDPNTVEGAIPLFGYNHIYIRGGGDLLTSANTWDEARRDAVKEINPAWIRFPGGTISNLFKWKDYIGPVEDRIGMHGFKFIPDEALYGPDEAGDLAEYAGSQLLIQVGANQSAEYIADWVEYMNAEVGENPNGGIDYAQIRSDNGHPEPYNVKHWEIVNEVGNDLAWPRWSNTDDPIDTYKEPGFDYSFSSEEFRTWATYGGDKSFSNYKAVRRNAWDDEYVKLEGIANEKRYTKLSPVVRNSFTLKVGEDINTAVEWTMVDDFSVSSSTDLHFTFDENKGEITFGDNINGAIPTAGQYVFTDFSIENYDGYVQIYNAMKAVDPSIKIATSYFWLPDELPNMIEATQRHGIPSIPETYPDDAFNESLSKALGIFSSRYIDDLSSNLPFFVTELPTYGLDMGHSMFHLLAYAKSLPEGDKIPVLGFNYMLRNGKREAHINKAVDGSIVQGPGLVTKLFRTHFGTKYVPTISSDIPTQNINYYVNGNLENTDIEKIYTVSTLSENEDALYIMCINTTKDETITSDIIIENSNVESIESVHRLKASSLTALNTESNPNEIEIETESIPSISSDNLIAGYQFPPATATVFRIQIKQCTKCTPIRVTKRRQNK